MFETNNMHGVGYDFSDFIHTDLQYGPAGRGSTNHSALEKGLPDISCPPNKTSVFIRTVVP